MYAIRSYYAYDLNNSDPAVQALGEGDSLPDEVFTVKTLDGTETTVTVSITGTNDGADVTQDSGAVKEDEVLSTSGKLDVTDTDSGEAYFVPQTAVAGAHGTFNVDEHGNWTYSYNFV